MRGIFGDRPGIFMLCLLVWTLSNMDQALFGYAIPGILAEFRLPLQTIGAVLTISFASAVLLIIMSGIAADRWGRGLVLCALLLSSAVFVGLQGFAGGIVVLTFFRALGFGLSGGLSPITNALVVESANPRYRGVAMGLLQCGYPLGWLLASFAAAPLLDAYGWRAVCFVAFLVVPLVLPIGWLLARYGVARNPAPPTPAPATAQPGRGSIAILLSPPYRRTTLATMGLFFMFGGAYAGSAFFFPTYFTQVRGYSEAEAASLVGLSNGIAVFGYLAAALIGEFIMTRRNVFVIWCLLGAAGLAGLLWLSGNRTQDLLWYGATAALFFGSQAVVAVFVAEIYPARFRATALAFCASAPLSLGFAVFPLAVPFAVAELGWNAGLTLMVIPLLVGAGLLALALPNRRSGEPID
jgi:MFS family permease